MRVAAFAPSLHRGVALGLIALAALERRAAADEPPQPAPAPSDAQPQPEPTPAAPPSTEERLRAVEAQNAKLAGELEQLRQDHASLDERLSQLMSQVSGRLTGYVDFGFFHVEGGGVGIRSDTGHLIFPQYADVPASWVFYGDPLSTAINSRGEPADTGESRAVTFNPVHNGGVTSFIVNALNVQLFAGLGPNLTVNGSFDLVPRSRNVSDASGLFLGDFVDVKLAYAEYTLPIDRFDLRLSAGKFDSVLGIEYRSQEAPARFGVTPSLICRYTCGRPLGLKARARFGDDLLVIAIAVTNGSHMTEGFPFANEIDVNDMKTFAGRLSTKLPLFAGLEIGASVAGGAQDFQADNGVFQWHYGFDLHLMVRDLDVKAEFVQGSADGKSSGTGPSEVPCGTAPCLQYKGAYGQIAYRLFNWLGLFVRVDWRDAFHRSGQSFVYVSKLVRGTAGIRIELGANVILKAEYTYDRELDPLPQIPNDVFTTSMVFKL